ncbi:molybdopterin-binding protein, partial [Rubrivirga sp.]|uniref:molybdopterin-binding protein n=1 Tax=Rubrivirga sp. TaxID=1885344 RepID=UPI003C758EC1
HALDDAPSIRAALDRALEADVIVFAGGVSMGDLDLVRPELERRGVEWLFWGVRQRPGKPLAFGVLDGRPVFGLPGNPVSAAVCFEVYVRSLLDVMLGRTVPPLEIGVLEDEIPKAAGLHTFARVMASRGDRLRLSSAGNQASHAALSLLVSDGLAHLPAGLEDAPAGLEVEYQRWPWRQLS